ncbi:hypothetical protein MBA17_32945 [Streptosporangium sp. KLBMP 9127]|nr:hypothetical protein [Streptosporangium sp. KLBMP 9127]
MYDMGFRDYNPGLNRFLTLDRYNGALANLGLDPWTANRYAFTGGNPITGIELDGHVPDHCLYGYCTSNPTPTPKPSPQPSPEQPDQQRSNPNANHVADPQS